MMMTNNKMTIPEYKWIKNKMYPLQIFKKIILGPNVCLCVCFLCKSNIQKKTKHNFETGGKFFQMWIYHNNNNNKIGDETEIEIEKKNVWNFFSFFLL